MTLATNLLDLTLEYQRAIENRQLGDGYPGTACGRDPETIAEDYATALRSLIADESQSKAQ